MPLFKEGKHVTVMKKTDKLVVLLVYPSTTPLTTPTPSLVKTSREKAVVGLCQAVYLY